MLARGQVLANETGDWTIDLAQRELRLRGVPVALGRRAFDIVEVLAESAGELVSKDQLMGRVWPGVIVEENTLQVHISAIRKALGPERGLLKTASGRGYRLAGSWTVQPQGTSAGRIHPAAAAPVPLFQSNLPVAASDLIGRTGAAQQLRDLLSAYRVVTLTGPGGIGKTALALEVARSLVAGFHGDSCFVELAALSDPGLVPSAAAGSLSLSLGGDEISAESVGRALGGKKLILVLDNCEHVIETAARLAEAIVRLCPHATVLATSREVLRIDGEFVYRVPPLDVPALDQEEPQHVMGNSAVQLFVARTQALDAGFAAHRDNLPAIAAICRHLDGIPLAIEFAAARAATLGVQQVADGLDDRFGLLTSGRRTALPRHQTLRATLDWSYQLLPEDERRLLRHLAIFPAGFTLEAAEAVASDTSAGAIAEGIASLVAKSLLNRDGSAQAGRWRLLETIRTYALEKLAQSGEHQRAAQRHAAYFRDFIVPAAAGSVLRLSFEDVARYGREIDNVRAALDWSFSAVGEAATGVVLTAAFAPVWLHLSLTVECVERIERALVAPAPGLTLIAPLERRLNIALAVALILTMGPVERARAAVAKAREIAERVGDPEAQLRMLWAQWSLEFTTGEPRAAQSTAGHFTELARQTADQATVLVGDRLMGNALQYGGNQRDAQTFLERVLQHYVAPPSQRHTVLFHYDQHALARAMLARVLWLQGAVDRANSEARLSLDEARAADPGYSVCWVLHYALCPLALMTGDIAAAERAVAAMIDRAANLNAAIWRIVARCWEGKLLIARREFAAGADLLRNALETCERTGWLNCYPEFMGALAEGVAGLGQPGAARVIIERALARAESGGERWYEAELLRIKGEVLLQEAGTGSIPAAEDCFKRGLAVAQEQGALFWELRLALALALLRVEQDRPLEARQLLAPLCDRFTDGFETADLRGAKAMLQSLS